MPVDPVTAGLREIRERLGRITDGEVANYIPELARADPDAFGIAVVSMSGHRYLAGDTDVAFSIQSVSKPFVYALALADLGLDAVLRRVNAEPSGEAYNAISLEPGTGRPANPMVNAGAIVTTSLIVAPDAAARFERIRACLSAFAGRDLDVDEQVYASEAATGDRNRALAYLMRGAGSLVGDVHEIVETYFRQCSVRVTAADLAVMAATLANGGVNPLTGVTVIQEPVAVQVLALMATCGLYDEAGAWLLRAGLPAKSGVSGGLIAASPARLGIAVYSPPLDVAGNSVRGVKALTEASERFALHLMHRPLQQTLTVTDRSTAREHPSARPRDAAATAILRRDGRRIAIVSAQGTLEFTETERLLNEVRTALPPAPGWLVLDLERVTHVAKGAAAMLGATLGDLVRSGYEVAVTAQESMAKEAHRDGDTWTVFAGREQAVAWCEDRLLAGRG
ncbi:glutaminase A [Streptomyces sp. SID3343]|nr:glutaminase A [Streptomyces sp. SID3343]